MMRSAFKTEKLTLLQSLPLLLLFLCFGFTSARALDPAHRISQYAHTAWRIQDGAFSGIPTAIAQTTDGYLWLGTRSGLVRFDGVRFVPWVPPGGKKLQDSYIDSLADGRDGSLWIGTSGGVRRWANQELTNYPVASGVASSIFEDHDGKIWFLLLQIGGHIGTICQVVDSGTRCYGKAATGYGLVEDALGNLWAGDHNRVVQWNPVSSNASYYTILMSSSGIDGVRSIVTTPAGSLWVGISLAGPGLGLQQLDHGKWKPFIAPELDSSTLTVLALLLDREGSLWVGTGGQGLYRIRGTRVDRFSSADGLSSDTVHALYEDHEGNLWVATAKGIDAFRDVRVTSIPIPSGIGSDEADGVLATRDGTVWLGRPESLDALRHDKISTLQEGKGLPGNQVTSLFEDHAGRFWVGIDDTLSIYRNGKFNRISRRDGSPVGVVTGMTEDVENNVWVETTGQPRTLLRIYDFKVQEELPAPQMPAARKVAADPQGGIWLGLMTGDLARYRKGKIEVFSYPHGGPNAFVEQLTISPDGSVLGGTPAGLIAWKNGKQQTLTSRNGLPCNDVYAQIFDEQGDLWLYMECGLVKITDAELQKWWERPDTRLEIKVFDVLDGARPGFAPFGGAARTPDGRLWFVNSIGLQMVDPAHTASNTMPPPVHIETLIADHKSYSLREAVQLPPLPRDLEIDYTGLSFVVPQKVRFRYKLEGHDKDWEEPGARRQAFYSDLRPGKYRFHVIACNNDGVWNEEGAALDFVVLPKWYQTSWFLVLSIASAAFMAWLLYHLRLRQLSASMSARFDERLAERTRLAREIHDTLLQTIQGSKMVADDALDESTDLPRMRRAMGRLSGWLGQAMQEGRAALNSLRTSTTQTNDLAESFHRALDDCSIRGFSKAGLVVEGDPTEMHPIVRDEIYRIGYEAIRNACQHSGASRLDVLLSYSQDLILSVSDNGKGMDADIAAHGKESHFGMQGMRERALQIGGKLSVVSSADSGTRIELIVPGHIVFRGRRPMWTVFTEIKRFFVGTGHARHVL